MVPGRYCPGLFGSTKTWVSAPLARKTICRSFPAVKRLNDCKGTSNTRTGAARSAVHQECGNIAQDALQHPFGQFSRERVLLARVVGDKQPGKTVAEVVAGPVPEGKGRQAAYRAGSLQGAEVYAHGDASQREKGPWLQHLQLSFKIGAAIVQLRRQRFIRRRRASGGRGNISVLEPESVLAVNG